MLRDYRDYLGMLQELEERQREEKNHLRPAEEPSGASCCCGDAEGKEEMHVNRTSHVLKTLLP